MLMTRTQQAIRQSVEPCSQRALVEIAGDRRLRAWLKTPTVKAVVQTRTRRKARSQPMN